MAAPLVSTGFQGLPALAAHPWAYPALEALHIVGIALLLGNLVLFELRVWGLAPELPLRPLARLSLALSLGGFGVLALTGMLMFATQPNELLANRAFTLKMGLILLAAGCNAAWFNRGSLQRLDSLAKVQALLSLGLWLSVLTCGRFIAYV
jgi:hypothetical protein